MFGAVGGVGDLEVGDGSRVGQDTGSVTFVKDDVVLGKGSSIDAGGVVVDTAPDENLVLLGDGETVEVSGGDVGDLVLAFQAWNHSGLEDTSFAFTSLGRDTGLTVVVQSPAVDRSIFVDGKGVVGASSNVNKSLARANLLRNKTLVFGTAFNEATSQLVLFARSPGVYGAVSQEGENVVATSSELGDILNAGNESRSTLDFNLWREAPDTIAVLKKC
jgi:hypothetical protein